MHTALRRHGRRRLLRLAGGMLAAGLAGKATGGAPKQAMSRSPTTVAGNSAVTLFLCGDVMTGRGIDQILPHPGDPRLYEPSVRDAREYVTLAEERNGAILKPVNFDYIWGEALAELARMAPAARIVNLETAVTARDTPAQKGIHYRMNPANIPCLTAAGIDCCTLANNHVLDWGRAGLEDTLVALDRAGIGHAGAGHDIDEARRPAVISLDGGGRVLVFAFGSETSGIGRDWGATPGRPGVNLLPDLSPKTAHAFAEILNDFRRPGDIVVASIHWGANWGYRIPEAQRDFAHALIDDTNVHIVHGHSSHHVKGIEVYRHRPVIYGCGDFLTDYEGIRGYEHYRDDLGLMYFPRVERASGRLQALDMTPTRLKNLQVTRASPAETRWLAEMLDREGKALGTHVTVTTDHRLRLHWDAPDGV